MTRTPDLLAQWKEEILSIKEENPVHIQQRTRNKAEKRMLVLINHIENLEAFIEKKDKALNRSMYWIEGGNVLHASDLQEEVSDALDLKKPEIKEPE